MPKVVKPNSTRTSRKRCRGGDSLGGQPDIKNDLGGSGSGGGGGSASRESKQISFRVPDGIAVISPSSPVHPWHTPPQCIWAGGKGYPNLAYFIYASVLDAIMREVYREGVGRIEELKNIANSLCTATLPGQPGSEEHPIENFGKPAYLDKKLSLLSPVEQTHCEQCMPFVLESICAYMAESHVHIRDALALTGNKTIVVRMPGGKTTSLGGRLNRKYVDTVTQAASSSQEIAWDTDLLFIGSNYLGRAWMKIRGNSACPDVKS